MTLLDVGGKAQVNLKEVVAITKGFDDTLMPQGNPFEGRFLIFIYMKSMGGPNFLATRWHSQEKQQQVYEEVIEEFSKQSEF